MRFKHLVLLIFLTTVLISVFSLRSVRKMIWFDFGGDKVIEKNREVLLSTRENVLLKEELGVEEIRVVEQIEREAEKRNKKLAASKVATTSEIKSILLDIPFTPQAPFAEWDDPRQQDGCEEAAALMAVSWARGRELTKKRAKEEILAASKYEQEKYGEYRDTSATDTAERIIKGYFGYKDFEVKEVAIVSDIIKELRQGQAIITPMNGRKLGNPFYTRPGPVRHMLVIRGYDPKTKEFITNDNGTRRGEEYRYPKKVFYEAIRDYPTGYHEPIEVVVKVMIVVKAAITEKNE